MMKDFEMIAQEENGKIIFCSKNKKIKSICNVAETLLKENNIDPKILEQKLKDNEKYTSFKIICEGVLIRLIIHPFQEYQIIEIFEDKEISHLNDIIKEKEDEVLKNFKLTSLGEMAAGIAHDINNPLGIIISALEMSKFDIEEVEKPNQETKQLIESLKENFKDIEMGVSRASDIVEGMRMYSRKDQDTFRINNLNDVIKSSISFSKRFINKNKIKLNYKENNINLKSKEVLLSQVIINFIKNASDAIANLPSNQKWIDIELSENQENIFLSITDGGNGIPLEIQEKIFEPFFTTKEVGKGTGLGLSMAFKIIGLHQGIISIDKKCQNTRFILSFKK